MEGKKLSRRERQRLTQRREILDAALELFSKKGYRKVSMFQIAEKAEFAVGTLYKFFQNKEDLYKTLILELVEGFRDALARAVEEPDQEIEKLRNYVTVKGELFSAQASMIRLYFSETHGASFNVMAGLDSRIRELRNDFLKTLASVFEKGMKRKTFRKIADPFHLAVALENLTNAFLFLWLENPEQYPYPEDPETVLNILFVGLLVR